MTITRRKPLTARIGIYAVGHEAYWPQFDGLLEELMGYHDEVIAQIKAQGAEVVDFGMVDNAAGAYAALPKIKAADVDVLFVDMVTYASSCTFGVIARALDVPIVLVALQP